MAKSLLSAIAAIALAAFASTAAHAVTIYGNYNFDFANSTYQVSSSSGVGNSMIYKSTTDPKLQVKITAWSIDRNPALTSASLSNSADDVITKATLSFYSGYGLGVQNKYEDGSAPNHSIDNGIDTPSIVGPDASHYMVDFVLLQFDYDVDVNSFGTGWVSGDQDVSLRVGAGPVGNPAQWQSPLFSNNAPYDDGNAATTIDLTNYLNTAIANSVSNSGSPQDPRYVNPTNQHGMVWLLGALYGTDNNDFFKLDALNVTVFPTIPEPSTWMTMILGFGFVGWTMRRRNASLDTGSAALA